MMESFSVDPRDAEDAHEAMDHSRFMGRDIEVEFTRGYRKTPAEMRSRDRYGDSDDRRGYTDSRKRRASRSVSRMRDRRHISRSRSRSLSQPRSRDRQSPTGNTSGDYKRGDKGSTSEQSMSLRGDRDSGREQRRFREETKENGDARSPDHGRSRRQPFRSPADGRRRRRPASGSQNSRDEDQNE